ncbi:AraC family transcriptional regulator [Gelidibacter sediminis]|uniref:AraC family transcriptional regulator n=1 Tax=Gelidibacter sediminis TaxID=1608710 RepID=A0A4R7Q685_9FLAO|nr:AraC family transcriptional regulator [Gelidibacter sediminis]TDU43097.1 AraC family transcriptional regulator [Gelidibacter sediminis]
MKVLLFKIPKPNADAFVYQYDKEVAFYDKLHQHEEIQLSLILEGTGTLLVGDTVNYYTKGDVLVIGSNLPHVFKSDVDNSATSQMLTLFFTKQSFGPDFFKLEELKELQPFFERSIHGFKMTSNQEALKALFLQLEEASKLNQFLILLQLIKITSNSNYQSLSSFVYDKKYSDNEGTRMRNVFEYTMNNFDKEVTLKAVSEVANMTKNAFCKYFKKRTNKTYIQFLNELRLEHASRLLLVANDSTIAEIAEASGFNNISNFNRQFKAVKHLSPKEFKNKKRLTI